MRSKYKISVSFFNYLKYFKFTEKLIKRTTKNKIISKKNIYFRKSVKHYKRLTPPMFWETMIRFRKFRRINKIRTQKRILFKIIKKKWVFKDSHTNWDSWYTTVSSKKKTSLKKEPTKKKIKKQLKLSKKQLKRIKFKKLSTLIWPDSNVFKTFKICSRKTVVCKNLLKHSIVLVHDGYSWKKVTLNVAMLNLKLGSIAFQTRSFSPVSFQEKRENKIISMAQSFTYKIKSFKVKRKK